MTGRELTYQRNEVLLRAFRRLGQVEVIQNKHPSRSLFWNSFWITLLALPKLLTGKYSVIFVGFYGHLIMLPVGLLARLRRIPVLFDVFVSNYDTLVQDRQTISPHSFAAKLAKWLDKTSCTLATHLLIDTPLHVDYFVETYRIPSEKFSAIPVGCNEDIFTQRSHPSPKNQNTTVLYYCTYLPLHGAEIVIGAAKQLTKFPIHFHLIGDGQEYQKVRIQANDLPNVTFSPTVSLDTLQDEIAAADICLGGHFGMSDKAGRVVPGKIYQILAMARPLIASNSPANQALLRGQNAALLCPPGDAHALAHAILALHQAMDLRENIRHKGYAVYTTKCSETAITEMLKQLLPTLLDR